MEINYIYILHHMQKHAQKIQPSSQPQKSLICHTLTLTTTILFIDSINYCSFCRFKVLELARSLVTDSVLINKINSWKDKHLHQDLDDESDDKDNDQEIIGKGWWKGFC